jgi:hypothetical protein
VALEYQVHVFRNPYRETIPDEEFQSLLDGAVAARAEDIKLRHAAGEFERNQMAFVVLDPTVPAGARADEIVLAIAMIGPGADFFAPNAMAKAFCLRDHGADASVLVITRNHLLADGSFRFGGAVELAGTIVGGSGQTELQDRYQCTLLAADFNYSVAMGRKAWEQSHGPGRWYLNEQAPDARFRLVIDELLGDR